MLKIDEELKTIIISLEEYKELLIIKGKYEELKSNYIQYKPITYPTITYCETNGNELASPYTRKVTYDLGDDK